MPVDNSVNLPGRFSVSCAVNTIAAYAVYTFWEEELLQWHTCCLIFARNASSLGRLYFIIRTWLW